MTPEQIARETYLDDKSTRWWIHYPGAAYSCNVDFRNPEGVDRAINECLKWTGLSKLEEGTEIYI